MQRRLPASALTGPGQAVPDLADLSEEQRRQPPTYVPNRNMVFLSLAAAYAEAAGIRVTAVWSGFLVLTAATLTVNFQTVGGLMIYSLISNPAAAAFQVTRGCRRTMFLSAVFGAVSGLGGFLIAAATDLPSGAVIVLVSSALVGVAAVLARFRQRHS